MKSNDLQTAAHDIKSEKRVISNYGDNMIRQTSIAAILLCLGACASSGPAEQEQAETVAAADSNHPVIEMTESAMQESDPDEIVCRRERQTGSRMSTRVCRTRAEIEARAEKDQEALRNSRATQSGGQCVLEGTC